MNAMSSVLSYVVSFLSPVSTLVVLFSIGDIVLWLQLPLSLFASYMYSSESYVRIEHTNIYDGTGNRFPEVHLCSYVSSPIHRASGTTPRQL